MSRKTIYAVDFDGTLSNGEYPNTGEPNLALIEYLKKKKDSGKAILILWTCREGDDLQKAIDFCKKYGLEFYYYNDNCKELIKKYNNNNRKIYADVYIDDHAVNKPKWNVPFRKKVSEQNDK